MTIDEGLVTLEYEPVDSWSSTTACRAATGSARSPSTAQVAVRTPAIVDADRVRGEHPARGGARCARAPTRCSASPPTRDKLLREAANLRSASGPSPSAALTPPPGSLKLDDPEREAIRAALRESGGVVATAAKPLGIDRRTLQRKLKKFSAGPVARRRPGRAPARGD